jgi:hypothetical protein
LGHAPYSNWGEEIKTILAPRLDYRKILQWFCTLWHNERDQISFMLKVPVVFLVSVLFIGNVDGQITQRADAQSIDKVSRYVFYLPGRIVEPEKMRPISPKWGTYEYERILETLRKSGFKVVSEPRPHDSDVERYASAVADEVRTLLIGGVPAGHITVVGASQGSWIAMLVSTYLKNRDINFVFIAACSADPGFLKLVDLHGNVLSIYEKSDLAQSCADYRRDATGIRGWNEIELNTGLHHGFLFRPLKEWMEPTIAWAKK